MRQRLATTRNRKRSAQRKNQEFSWKNKNRAEIPVLWSNTILCQWVWTKKLKLRGQLWVKTGMDAEFVSMGSDGESRLSKLYDTVRILMFYAPFGICASHGVCVNARSDDIRDWRGWWVVSKYFAWYGTIRTRSWTLQIASRTAQTPKMGNISILVRF